MARFTLFAVLAIVAGVEAGPCRPKTTTLVASATTATSFSSVAETVASTAVSTGAETATSAASTAGIEVKTTTTGSEAQSTTTVAEAESTTTQAEIETTTDATTTTALEVQSTTTAAPADPNSCLNVLNPYEAGNGELFNTNCGQKVIEQGSQQLFAINGLTFRGCLDVCSQDASCLGVSYERSEQGCEV